MTTGFENHTPDNTEVIAHRNDEGDERPLVIRARKPLMAETGDVLVLTATGPFMPFIGGRREMGSLSGYLTKREAIFLRNRLTAFIESGLDDIS